MCTYIYILYKMVPRTVIYKSSRRVWAMAMRVMMVRARDLVASVKS